MSLLKTPPPAPVHSLEEMFAIAQAMEREATAGYASMAERMRSEGMPELAALFDRLAEDERAHEGGVLRWSLERSGKPPDPAAIRWALPETFDLEAAGELAASRLASAYRILSMAVRNEERAFSFWSYVAAEAETPEIRAAAERMAHEELEHVALLRRARRQAYHGERRHPDRPRPISERWVEALRLERRLARQLDALAGALPADAQPTARDLAARTQKMADEVAAMGAVPAGGPGEELDAEAAAERLVEDYLDIADLSRDEAVAVEAQALARRAIARLAWLRALPAHGTDRPAIAGG